MSGGSFNYLYWKLSNGEDEWPRPGDENVADMLEWLAGRGHGDSRLARDLRATVADIAEHRAREDAIDARGAAMSEALQAIEWEVSGDSCAAAEAIAKYEAEGT